MVRQRRTTAAVVIALALTASLAPTASALGVLGHSPAGSPPSVVRVVTHDGGFDWGDSGIGAGATLLLLGIGFAGTRAATNARRRHVCEQRAVATS